MEEGRVKKVTVNKCDISFPTEEDVKAADIDKRIAPIIEKWTKLKVRKSTLKNMIVDTMWSIDEDSRTYYFACYAEKHGATKAMEVLSLAREWK